MFKNINIDALADILGKNGVSVAYEQLEIICNDFTGHLDAMGEYESHQFAGSKTDACMECQSLKEEISTLKKKISCFEKSVKERTGASEVWIGNYGEVRYDY